MANRFLETNYYKSPFVRGLKGAIKGLYSFIICDCTHSGIWSKDMEAASMYIGFPVSDADFFENFVEVGKAVDIGGNKFFFPDFIEHQYPKGLQENNAAHIKVIFELKKLKLLDENNIQVTEKGAKIWFVHPKKKAPLKPLFSTYGSGNGKGSGSELGNDNGNGSGYTPPVTDNFIIPKMCQLWYTSFSTYTQDKENDSHGMTVILQFMLKQFNTRDCQNLETQEKVLEKLQSIADQITNNTFWINKTIKSIANNIQEFYNNDKNPIIKNGTGNNNTSTGGAKQTRVDALKKW